MITVKELIKQLKTMDPNRIVVIQKDSEGNFYSPLAGADDNAGYQAESTWAGTVLPQVASTYDQEAEDLADVSFLPCVVLYPIN